MAKLRRRASMIVVPLLATWAATAFAIERGAPAGEPTRTYDAIVVLGCRVRPDGTPSPPLARRAREGAKRWLEGRAPVLITTGGIGDHAPSEARVAADVALSLGVPAHAIALEDRSTSTEENARYARALVDARSVLVVTDRFHSMRAARIFRRHFAEVAVATVSGGPWARARGALREVPLLALELSRDLAR